MNRTHNGKRMMLLLVSALLMLLLCGCRTRLSNNTEVAATIADEDGYLTGNYELRRDELGMPVAEKPLFTGVSSDDDYDYSDYGSFDDYEPYEDDGWEEPDEPERRTSGDDQSTGSSSTGSRPTTPVQQRRTTGNVVVTLDANGGSVTPTSIRVTSGSTYGGLPVATRKGYDFQGWYTEKDDGKGTRVVSTTRVAKSTAHSLYAHWKKADNDDPNKVTVTLDLNDGQGTKATKKVAKNTTFGKVLTNDPVWKGHVFTGWYTKKSGGDKVDLNKKVTRDTTVYAHWEKAGDDPQEETDYDVDLDLNGGEGETKIRVTNGRYPDPLPTPTREGHYFKGWYIGKEKVEGGQESRGKTALTAQWEDYATYWGNKYKTASNNKDFKDTFYSDDLSDLVKGTETAADKKPAYVITSINDFTETDAEERAAEKARAYPGSTVIVVPSEAYKKDAWRQVYKLILLKYMYRDASTISDEDIADAAGDLGVELPDPMYYDYPTAASPSGSGDDAGDSGY